MRKTLSLLSLGVLAGTLSAQAGPAEKVKHTDSKTFTIPEMDKKKDFYITGATRKYLAQVQTVKLTNDTTGTYTTQLTVYGLHPQYGNTSQSTTQDYCVSGTWDPKKTGHAAYTPNKLCNDMNKGTGGNFGLMIGGGRGQYAVIDWSDGPYFSRRATFLQKFPKPTKISGISSSYVDPSIAEFDFDSTKAGLETVLFYVTAAPTTGQTQLMMAELDHSGFTSNPSVVKLVGKPRIVTAISRGTTGTIQVHSPTPVTDNSGRVHGLFLSERVGGDSDQYFQGDLNGTMKGHQQQLVYNGPNWTNNGGWFGGKFIYADSESSVTAFYGSLKEWGGTWLVGDEVFSGNTVTIRSGNANVRPGADVTVFFASSLIPGVSIPGFTGKLGLNPATLLVLGVKSNHALYETADISFPTPKGWKVNVAMQALCLDGGILSFSNTAHLMIK